MRQSHDQAPCERREQRIQHPSWYINGSVCVDALVDGHAPTSWRWLCHNSLNEDCQHHQYGIINPSIDGYAQKAEVVPLQSSMVDWYTMYCRRTMSMWLCPWKSTSYWVRNLSIMCHMGTISYGPYTCVVRYPYFYIRICVCVHLCLLKHLVYQGLPTDSSLLPGDDTIHGANPEFKNNTTQCRTTAQTAMAKLWV